MTETKTKGTPRERAESLTLGDIAAWHKRGLRIEVRRFGQGAGHTCAITLRGKELARASTSDAPHSLLNAFTQLFEQSDAEEARVVAFARKELL